MPSAWITYILYFKGLDTLGVLFEKIIEELCSQESASLGLYHVDDVDRDDNWLTLATPDQKALTLKTLGFKEDQIIELDAIGSEMYGDDDLEEEEELVKFVMDPSKSLLIDRKSHGRDFHNYETLLNGMRVKLETTGRVR